MIGQIVHDAIRFKRVLECEHVWKKLNDTEEQCSKCTVIVTEAGKNQLARMKQR